jgi:hypothetical protein
MGKRQDELALEIFEDLYYFLDSKLKLLSQDNPHRHRLEDIQQFVAGERRVLEEISLPCRFLLEHLMEQQHRGSTVELETENLIITKSPIAGISVQEWGKVKLRLGNLEVSWRDPGSQYYFYPDKVEIRSQDARVRGFQLFFSFPFKSSHGLFERYPDLVDHEQIAYWHPELTPKKE